MSDVRPAARASQGKPPPPPAPEPDPITIAFGVDRKSKDGCYVPVRLELSGGRVVRRTELHDSSPYESMAYEYLQGDVALHYASISAGHSTAMARANKVTKQ